MDKYLFDPAEDAWVAYLKDAQDERVLTNVPKSTDSKPRPVKFIEVEHNGGAAGLVSQDAMMTFRCWDETREAAAVFASEVQRLVTLARELGGRPVKRVRIVGTPVFLPDPDTHAARYQFTIQAAIRGRFPTP
ncbi:hypothetical protein G7068_03315 [Leucobacter viscericola]|uniref:Tail terminator n=1 Tax=Leucobacter viscericola TaxID=2714935 RepID=A0A6G7XCM3_9MICO|nr:hypothetical protein [Leucobacter viscericola]QIK62344.1 hypothetical protein G7068_03315 [Leucobacter viscericola]